jgi:hypothetical protein
MQRTRLGFCLLALALFLPAQSLAWLQQPESAGLDRPDQQKSGAAPAKQNQPGTPVRLELTLKDADAAADDAWFGVYVGAKKAGWIHMMRGKVTENGKSVYRDASQFAIKIIANGQKNEMKTDSVADYELQPPFRLVAAKHYHVDVKTNQRVTLKAAGKGYDAIISSGGVEQKKRYGDLDVTLADVLTPELWLKSKPAVNARITSRDLDLEDIRVDLTTMTYLATKEKLVGGVKLVYHEVATLVHRHNLEADSKYDDNGRLLSASMGGFMEFRRESEEEAKKTEHAADLFLNGLAKIDKAIGDGKNLEAVVLEIKLKDPSAFPDGPRQSAITKAPGIVELRLGKKYGKAVKATEQEIKENLEATIAFPIKDETLQRLAKEAVGNAKTDLEKVTNICAFVDGFVIRRYEGTIPKIHDLLKRKTGDCKSFALLFTCLCRAAGIPARTVGGFVYMGDADLTFGGHAWNEAVVDGYWLPVDATMNQVGADPRHISLGDENESTGNLLKTYGKLDFKLISVERGQ